MQTTRMIEFFVCGTPIPQGSMKAFVVGNRARVTSDNESLKPWREAVKSAAIEQRVTTIDEPLSVSLWFYLRRPASYPKRIVFPWKKPDLDKLTRGVFDALTEASVWRDDALVVDLRCAKRFAEKDIPTGCLISIERAS